MERDRERPVLSAKEKALEQLTQDFIMALSRPQIENLAGVDMMTAYVRATGHVRSLSLSHAASSSPSPCSGCGSSTPTE